MKINAVLEKECGEPQDPACASLLNIENTRDLISQQNKHHMLMFSKDVKRQAGNLATSLNL